MGVAVRAEGGQQSFQAQLLLALSLLDHVNTYDSVYGD